MIKIENVNVNGFEPSIRGMRNPKNSWESSDSSFDEFGIPKHIGDNDKRLMSALDNAGPSHSKYRRMITVYADIVAPLYWWKEFDTYKVGTVADSCSTMHKLHAKEFSIDDFSTDHMDSDSINIINDIIRVLNRNRESFIMSKIKDYWWQMVQLLPTSYNQRRTVMVNYEVLANIYFTRKGHKLDEWAEFREWIESLPESWIIIGENN